MAKQKAKIKREVMISKCKDFAKVALIVTEDNPISFHQADTALHILEKGNNLSDEDFMIAKNHLKEASESFGEDVQVRTFALDDNYNLKPYNAWED